MGSKSLGDWLELETGIPFYFQPLPSANPHDDEYKSFGLFLKKDILSEKPCKIEQNFITKISHGDGIEYEKLVKYFDKIIVIYRENTLEQAESMVWSLHKDVWHQNTYNTNFYEIDENFLKSYNQEILDTKSSMDTDTEMYKNLENCLHITYEEFFYSDNGIKKIEEYLGIKTKTKPNSRNKLRNGKRNLI